MPENNNNNGNSIGEDMNILEALISPELRLVKKYLLDEKGRLMLYHPVTQRIIFKVLKESDLLEELKEYHKAMKEEKKRKRD